MKTNLSFLSVALMVACSTASVDEKDQTSTAEEATVAETSDTTVDPEEETTNTPDPVEEKDPCIPDEDVEGMRLTGKIEYTDGSIGDHTNTQIKMCCSGGCMTAEWGEDGFCYPEGRLEEGRYAFKVIPLNSQGYATPETFIDVGDEDIEFEDTILVPSFSHMQDLEDGTFDAGNGLEIDVVSEYYTSPSYLEDYIAAVSIDPMTSGIPLHSLDADKIVGMWYLGSFGAEISPKWTFQVRNSDLPAGTTLNILNSSYYDGKWLNAGTATVGEDGIIRADADSGISILSTLILIKE